MGYVVSQKGYKCLHVPSNRVYVSRHVQFKKTIFPFKTLQSSPMISHSQVTSFIIPLSLLISSPTLQQFPLHAHHSNSPLPLPATSTAILATSLSPPQPILTLVPTHPMVTRTKDNSKKSRVFNDYVAHLASLESEPTCFSQAKLSPQWRTAMATEIHALATNNTWSLVSLPEGQTTIDCK
jgi:hypothetical protein